MKVYYNPNLKEVAKKLRNNSTLSEVLLWKHLKKAQMMGYRFHRQKPIDNFIVDFYCHKLKLIIEIDGSSHEYKGNSDTRRSERLKSLGFNILRFQDIDIKRNLENVLFAIRKWVVDYQVHTSSFHR